MQSLLLQKHLLPVPSALGLRPHPPALRHAHPPTTSWNPLYVTRLSHSRSMFPTLFFSVFASCKTEYLDKMTSKVASRTQIKREYNTRVCCGGLPPCGLPAPCPANEKPALIWTGWHEEPGLLGSHRVLQASHRDLGPEPSPARLASPRHPVFLPRSPPT